MGYIRLTWSCEIVWFFSKLQRHETAVVRIAAAVRPAFHTQLGNIISFTSITENSPNLKYTKEKTE